MDFFTNAIDVLQTLVIALGGSLQSGALYRLWDTPFLHSSRSGHIGPLFGNGAAERGRTAFVVCNV